MSATVVETMETHTNPVEKQSHMQRLRAELKEWEKAFASQNDGRKAERADIKQHPDIAQKYKYYNKLRSGLPCKDLLPQVPSSAASDSKKRRRGHSDIGHESTPVKKSQNLHPADIDPYDPPPNHTPVAVRSFVGPTPQKNGQVLGLFDLLSPSSEKSTPSKHLKAKGSTPNLYATPSRRRVSDPEKTLTATPAKASRTPQSSSKTNLLASFLTPSKPRFNKQHTPNSRKMKSDETPEFLRRGNKIFVPDLLPEVEESGDENAVPTSWSPVAVRMPTRHVGKGLSALVRGLRNMEEERLDEEMDLLREIEGEDSGQPPMPKKLRILVEDSQAPTPTETEMPLGADGEGHASSDEDALAKEGLGRDGRPLRIYKKKGQKRTTRKVNIMPSSVKWKPEAAWKLGQDPEEDGAVAETPRFDRRNAGENDEFEEVSEQEGSDSVAAKQRGARPASEGRAKPPRKVSATANPNFRALKIKSKISRGKGGGGRRFGKRR